MLKKYKIFFSMHKGLICLVLPLFIVHTICTYLINEKSLLSGFILMHLIIMLQVKDSNHNSNDKLQKL